ncbi:3-deoxy-D-manno-octulosonic acid transferase, partial [Vibrio campbellii]|nr:3-deoxy-D-manno-octulosonic acid transferase [Vibrio campbellii]
DKVGGHNVLEPAALGVPVITGPSYFNFQEIVDKMVSFSAIAITSNANTLAIEIKDLIQNESAYHQVKVSLLSVVNSNQGSLQKTLDKVTL